jgi:hypothetical protein
VEAGASTRIWILHSGLAAMAHVQVILGSTLLEVL